MKSTILALTALLTINFAAPATAQTDVNFGVTVGDKAGIVIIPSRRRDRDYYPHYRRDWDRRPRYRIYRPSDRDYYYGADRFDNPYRYDRRSRHRHRDGRYYYPRRGNSIQLRIGF